MKGFYSYSKGAPDAPPVLLTHGLLGAARSLHRLAEALSEKGFHVVAFDQRGHGHTPWAEDYSLAALADDLFEVMDASGFKQAHLVGHSLGARVSLAAAAKSPERVSSLTMLDAGVRVPGPHLDDLKDIIDPLPDSYPTKAAAEADLARHSTVFRQFLLSNLRSDSEPPHALRWVFDLAGIRRGLLREIQVDQTDAWTRVRCPTLLVRGQNSDALLDQDLAELTRLNPRARVATIPNAAHWLHVDNFTATLDTVARFLMELTK